MRAELSCDQAKVTLLGPFVWQALQLSGALGQSHAEFSAEVGAVAKSIVLIFPHTKLGNPFGELILENVSGK